MKVQLEVVARLSALRDRYNGDTPMIKLVSIALAMLVACAPTTAREDRGVAFFEGLETLCGQRFAGVTDFTVGPHATRRPVLFKHDHRKAAKLIPAAATNVRQFVYYLERDGKPRYRAVFDLAKPLGGA